MISEFFLMVIIFSIYSESNQKRILLILAIPGLWIVLRISTVEILSNLLFLLSYLLISKERHRLALLTIGLACLAKETMLIFAASYAVVFLVNRNWKILLEMPLFFSPFILWQSYLIHRFGLGGDFEEGHNFKYPFIGIYEKFEILLTEENNKHEYIFFIILCISIIFLLTKIKVIFKDHPYLILGTLSYLLLFSISSRAIYDYHLSYNRVYIPVFLFLVLVQKQKMTKIDCCFWTISSLSAIRVVYWIVH